jgi:Tol biopolymer transport system component
VGIKRGVAIAVTAMIGGALIAAPAAQATFPGENGKIFFSAREPSSGFYDIWSMNPDGSELVNLTDLPGGPGEGVDASVSGDGTRVAFTVGSQATSEVWIMNADGSNPTQLTNNTGLVDPPNALDQMPGISPDGTRIAFMTTRETPPMPTGLEYDIYVMNSDGSDPQPLLAVTGESYFPEFTPDGQTVVMAHEVTGDLDVAYVPATGGPFPTATAITTNNLVESTPSVSPDGTRVAFVRRLSLSNSDVLSIGIDGMNESPVAADAAQNESTPAYSPDGTKILFSAQGELMLANTDGSNAVPLDTGSATDPIQPDWAVAQPASPPPDGTAQDTDPPETEITKAPRNKTEKPKARFGFESDEPGSTFDCKLDKKDFAPCDSPRKYKHLKTRKHKFKVRATDPAGNTDPTPAKDKLKVVD